jgi:cobalt-zinc-cadmium efflux system outer membrane protein
MNVFFRAKWVSLFFGTLLFPMLMLYGQDMKYLTLEVAIDIAMKDNPRMLAAQKDVDAARGRSWGTWWLPDPSFAAEYEQIPTGKGLGAFGERRLAITQSIDFPTNIFFKKKFADNDVNVSRMALSQTRLEVVAEVKRAYFNFLAKRDQLKLAQQNLQLAQEFSDKAKTRFEVGEAPNLEYIRARVGAAQAKNQVSQARSELTSAQAAVNALLARPAEASVNAVDSLAYQPLNNSLEELKQRAFEIHPRLRGAGYQVAMSQQLRNLSWGSFLPAIEATAFRQKVEGNPGFYGIEFGFSLPLWFPFRQRGNIQEATATLNAAQWRFQNEKHILDAEIESAYARVQSTKEQVNLYTESLLDEAEEVYRVALRSYEEGESTYLELLEAQRTLIEVRAGYINALTNYNSAVADLEQAVGGDLE